MTEEELGGILREAYHNAPRGDQMLAIKLFGIWYADEFELDRGKARRVMELAGISTLGPTLNMGRKLARYVSLNEEGKRLAAQLSFE